MWAAWASRRTDSQQCGFVLRFGRSVRRFAPEGGAEFGRCWSVVHDGGAEVVGVRRGRRCWPRLGRCVVVLRAACAVSMPGSRRGMASSGGGAEGLVALLGLVERRGNGLDFWVGPVRVEVVVVFLPRLGRCVVGVRAARVAGGVCLGRVRLSPWTVSTAPSNAHTGGWLVFLKGMDEASLWSVSRCALGLAGGDVEGVSEGGLEALRGRSGGCRRRPLGQGGAPSTRFSTRRCGWAGRGSRLGSGAQRFPRSKRCNGERDRPTRVERREARLVRGLHAGAGGRDGGRPRGGVGGEA